MLETEHRIMAECKRMCPVRDLQEVVNRNKILAAVYLAHPGTVMISYNQSLFTVQPLQNRLRLLAAEKQIADDTDSITVLNPAVPALYDGFVHFFYRLKRTVAKLQDILVSKVCISYEIKHSITSHLFVNSIYEIIPIHKCAI